jgi:hypothetical protein
MRENEASWTDVFGLREGTPSSMVATPGLSEVPPVPVRLTNEPKAETQPQEPIMGMRNGHNSKACNKSPNQRGKK